MYSEPHDFAGYNINFLVVVGETVGVGIAGKDVGDTVGIFDFTDTSKRHFYVNGISDNTWDVFVTGKDIGWSDTIDVGILNKTDGSASTEELISNVYFTTDYIDFSQEANRNLFVNQLGYPRDLTPLIEDGTIPAPLINMKFEDTDNLGKNEYGTDFSVVGTVTAGADFKL